MAWDLIGKLLEPSALLRRENLHDPITSRRPDVFDLRFQILVILHEIIQDCFEAVGLFRREIQLGLQPLIGEVSFVTAPVSRAAMQLLVQALTHSNGTRQRTGEKYEN